MNWINRIFHKCKFQKIGDIIYYPTTAHVNEMEWEFKKIGELMRCKCGKEKKILFRKFVIWERQKLGLPINDGFVTEENSGLKVFS